MVPADKPLKLIRDFKEYVRLFIFSFIQYQPDLPEAEEDGPMQIKCSTLGLLHSEIQIKFLKRKCSIVVKFIQDKTFRLTLYIVGDADGAFEHGLGIDIK